jgi:hypothetical protein
MPNRLSRALRQLGVRSLRPGQHEVIDGVLAGRDPNRQVPLAREPRPSRSR